MGGFRVQGTQTDAAERVIEDARALEAAGVYAMVVEGVPAELGRRVTEAVGVPTIGIGAGPDCDGQVLVCYDFLGMYSDVRPKFVKRFAELGDAIVAATQGYVSEVRSGAFPTADHSFGTPKLPKAERATGSRPIVEPPAKGYSPASDPVVDAPPKGYGPTHEPS